jgi:hypothetical protein
MPIALDQTRREWEHGYAGFQRDLREAQRPEAVRAELDAVTAALRRRIGQSFSLPELADLYATADDWAREAVAEAGPANGWPRRLATVTEAAFYLYARGAVDYEP